MWLGIQPLLYLTSGLPELHKFHLTAFYAAAEAAEARAASEAAASFRAVHPIAPSAAGGRIVVGYLSTDFRNHTTGRLTRRLYVRLVFFWGGVL